MLSPPTLPFSPEHQSHPTSSTASWHPTTLDPPRTVERKRRVPVALPFHQTQGGSDFTFGVGPSSYALPTPPRGGKGSSSSSANGMGGMGDADFSMIGPTPPRGKKGGFSFGGAGSEMGMGMGGGGGGMIIDTGLPTPAQTVKRNKTHSGRAGTHHQRSQLSISSPPAPPTPAHPSSSHADADASLPTPTSTAAHSSSGWTSTTSTAQPLTNTATTLTWGRKRRAGLTFAQQMGLLSSSSSSSTSSSTTTSNPSSSSTLPTDPLNPFSGTGDGHTLGSRIGGHKLHKQKAAIDSIHLSSPPALFPGFSSGSGSGTAANGFGGRLFFDDEHHFQDQGAKEEQGMEMKMEMEKTGLGLLGAAKIVLDDAGANPFLGAPQGARQSKDVVMSMGRMSPGAEPEAAVVDENGDVDMDAIDEEEDATTTPTKANRVTSGLHMSMDLALTPQTDSLSLPSDITPTSSLTSHPTTSTSPLPSSEIFNSPPTTSAAAGAPASSLFGGSKGWASSSTEGKVWAKPTMGAEDEENPFLVGPGRKGKVMSEEERERRRNGLAEKETINYVFRGTKTTFANPYYHLSAQGTPQASKLKPEHVDFSPAPVPKPRLLWKDAHAAASRTGRHRMDVDEDERRGESDDSDDDEGGHGVLGVRKPAARLLFGGGAGKAGSSGSGSPAASSQRKHPREESEMDVFGASPAEDGEKIGAAGGLTPRDRKRVKTGLKRL